MTRPLNDSTYLYGLHDPGGEQIMLQGGAPGWMLVTVAIGSQRQRQRAGRRRPLLGQLPPPVRPGPGRHRPPQQRLLARRHAALRARIRQLRPPLRQLRAHLAGLPPLADRQRDQPPHRVAGRRVELGRRAAAPRQPRQRGREDHAAALRLRLPQGAQRHQGAARPRRRPGAGGRASPVEQPDQLPRKPARRLGAVPGRHPAAARSRQLRRHHHPLLHPRRRPRAGHLRRQGGRWPLRHPPLEFPRLPGFHARHPGEHAPPAGLPDRVQPGRQRLGRPQLRLGARGIQGDRPLEQDRRAADPLPRPLPLSARRQRPLVDRRQERRHRRLSPVTGRPLSVAGAGRARRGRAASPLQRHQNPVRRPAALPSADRSAGAAGQTSSRPPSPPSTGRLPRPPRRAARSTRWTRRSAGWRSRSTNWARAACRSRP